MNSDFKYNLSCIGGCCWIGSIREFLCMPLNEFLDAMKVGTRRRLGTGALIGGPQCAAWRDERRWLWMNLKRLPERFLDLSIAFEWVIPGWPDKDDGRVRHYKVPDAVVFSDRQTLVLEFKQREPPPYDGFAKETRGYLRLLENWHPKVPRMSAKGALVLTKAVNFGKKYPRVRAISPDRIPAIIRKTFDGAPSLCSDSRDWLSSVASKLNIAL